MFGNNVEFLGRITHDLELRTISSGTSVLDFTLARNRMKTKDGEDAGADFVRCTAWGKIAETINTYFRKGERIGVSGRLQTDNYEDKDGNKRSTTKIMVESIEFIEKKNSSGDTDSAAPATTPTKTQSSTVEDDSPSDNEDYPF